MKKGPLRLVMNDAKFKQFRDKRIKVESNMNELFRGHVAREDDIIAPNMDPLPMLMEEVEDRLWHEDSPVSTPPPISQGIDRCGNGKGKRKWENFSSCHNKSAKTNGYRRMGSTTMMYEKLDIMLEVEREASRWLKDLKEGKNAKKGDEQQKMQVSMMELQVFLMH
ncbi:hypothetical protein Cgig2_003051 [Carnegiea gigantea]|uniref:Uncharacterized protein n=1 Tax=Carnegiea gigantea TaxID=171969 RepID=A0A9Q1Q6L0_9CARY|nr:hypothetical protein Cgig2_003051 [Carnegiea gigantea]